MTLKDYRLAAGLTQKQLAEKLGVPYQTVQKYEAGVRSCEKMTLKLATSYADALGITPEQLISAEKAPSE